jgi:hypothetical protein
VKHKWVWLLAGWLLVTGLASCSRAVSSLHVETVSTAHPDTSFEAVTSTVAVEPASTQGTGSSPHKVDLDGETSPSAVETPIEGVVPTSSRQSVPEVAVTAVPTAPILGGASTEIVELAKEDLAHRLGVPVNSVAVVAVVRQEFTTDAFYCQATKGRVARDESPALVSGESIVLSAGDCKYEYHARGQTVIYCRRLP